LRNNSTQRPLITFRFQQLDLVPLRDVCDPERSEASNLFLDWIMRSCVFGRREMGNIEGSRSFADLCYRGM